MKKVNKNKKVVEFIKDFDEIKKGTKKMLPLKTANDLIDKKIVKLLPSDTEKLQYDVDKLVVENKKEIDSLKKRIQFLENIVNGKKKKDNNPKDKKDNEKENSDVTDKDKKDE